MGTLNLTILGEIDDVFLARIKVFQSYSNDAFKEDELVFDYELPLNFQHDCDLSETLYAIKGPMGQYFGFLF